VNDEVDIADLLSVWLQEMHRRGMVEQPTNYRKVCVYDYQELGLQAVALRKEAAECFEAADYFSAMGARGCAQRARLRAEAALSAAERSVIVELES